MRNADVDISIGRNLGKLCCSDLLEGGLFNVELYERAKFIRSFDGGDLYLLIIYRRLRNDNAIMINGLVKEVGHRL
jgi:hypothetical protein